MSEQSLEMHFKMQLNLHGFSEVDAVLAFLKMGTAKALFIYSGEQAKPPFFQFMM